MKRRSFVTLLAACAIAGCTPAFSPPAQGLSGAVLPPATSSKIRHVVIIIQENRSVDDLFNGLPGADTVRSGKNSYGQTVRLRAVRLTAPYDIGHEHAAYLIEDANGKLNGFNKANSQCHRGKHCIPRQVRAYGYVPQSEIEPYWNLATQYAFADRMFQSNEGPSFPAHQYLFSGTSTVSQGSTLRAASNAFRPFGGFTGGCDSPTGSLVWLIDDLGNENQATYPCFDRPTLSDLVQSHSLTWRYYVAHVKPGLWNAPDAISHIRNGSGYTSHVVEPPAAIYSDISQNRLANVVWVTPTAAASDHAGQTDGTGPSWVASVVNAIGNSSYWSDTVIFVTWDDWGGWFDHVRPPHYNAYELGFRVPLIAVSPYAKPGYVSHRRHEFGSILKFVERNFALGSLHTTDQRSDDLSDMFNFSQAPLRFRSIAAPRSAQYFLRQPLSTENPDDD